MRMGIGELKELLGLILSVGEAIESVGGSKGLSAVLKFLPVIPRLGPGLGNINLVIPEIKDLSEEERSELKAFVSSDFDLKDESIEASIEQALYVLIDLSQLIQVLNVAKK
jgi:hypothetical protein